MSENEETNLPWEPISQGSAPPPPPMPEKGLANIVISEETPSQGAPPWDQPAPVVRQDSSKTDSDVSGNRINPDSRPVLLLAVGLVMVLMVSSFVVSFFGIWSISAETTNIPDPISWIPALFLDAAILAYTISYFVFQARGESVIRTRLALWVFALLSVAANVVDTFRIFTPETPWYEMAVGIGITGSAPIAVVLASEEIARLAFQRTRRTAKK